MDVTLIKKFEGCELDAYKEMAQKWPSDVSLTLIRQALSKIGFTRKKNL
jgi:hypothetical protein